MKPWHFVPIAILLLVSLWGPGWRPANRPVEYSAFKELLRAGDIRRVEMRGELLIGFEREGEATTGPGRADRAEAVRALSVPDPSLVPLLDSLGIEYLALPSSPWRGEALLAWTLPFLLLLGALRFLMPRAADAGQGLLGLGKSRAHAVTPQEAGVTFEDVAGVDEAKEELREVIDFLKRPERYAAIGGRVPKGVLLVGPPGTGKTLLARAVAGEARVPFFEIGGAEFVEMIVGVGAARVRDMFSEARRKAPCILFIDELDAIGKSRSNALLANDEREQTLNQLLVEMQGFDSRSGVIVLAATNRPDVLDPALLRPGRFDRHVLVDRPDLGGREAILRRHAAKVAMDESADLRQVAAKTPGFVGADLATLVNEAALLAVRGGRERVSAQDLDEAIEKAVSGLKKKGRLISPREKEVVAIHEAGHALAACLTAGADPVDKISIIPRGFGSLGFTRQTPAGDKYLLTEAELLARVDVALGGRAAERMIFGEISTGATDDLERATEIARQMVTEYGMSGRFRDVVLRTTRRERAGPWEGESRRENAEATLEYVDEEIERIIGERRRRVDALLSDHRALLLKIAGELVAQETLPGERLRALLEEDAAREEARKLPVLAEGPGP